MTLLRCRYHLKMRPLTLSNSGSLEWIKALKPAHSSSLFDQITGFRFLFSAELNTARIDWYNSLKKRRSVPPLSMATKAKGHAHVRYNNSKTVTFKYS